MIAGSTRSASRTRAAFFAWGEAPADAPRSALGWPTWPAAFRDELIDLSRRYRLPIYVMAGDKIWSVEGALIQEVDSSKIR